MYLLRQTTPSSLFIIPLWIVSMRNGFVSSTRTLRFFQPTIHPSDTTKMTSLYYFILCILINGCLRSLSSSVIHMTVLHDLPLLLPLPWMRFSVIVEKPLKVKYILCHSNPAVRTLIVNYGQFSLFPGEAISSLRFNPLGVQMASKETENNASAKLWADKQRALWVCYGIFCGGQ